VTARLAIRIPLALSLWAVAFVVSERQSSAGDGTGSDGPGLLFYLTRAFGVVIVLCAVVVLVGLVVRRRRPPPAAPEDAAGPGRSVRPARRHDRPRGRGHEQARPASRPRASAPPAPRLGPEPPRERHHRHPG